MATIKSFTDLEQSKILEKILPPESADSVIVTFGDREGTKTVVMPKETLDIIRTPFSDIRETVNCWSLAALLDILPYPTLAQHANGLWSLTAWRGHRVLVCRELRIECLEQPLERLELAVRVDKNYNVFALIDNLRINLTDENNLVDACYKTILELHEQNIL